MRYLIYVLGFLVSLNASANGFMGEISPIKLVSKSAKQVELPIILDVQNESSRKLNGVIPGSYLVKGEFSMPESFYGKEVFIVASNTTFATVIAREIESKSYSYVVKGGISKWGKSFLPLKNYNSKSFTTDVVSDNLEKVPGKLHY